MTFVVVLQVNLSAGASNNGDVSALLIYYFLTRFVKRRFIVCRKFSKLRQVALLDLVPALDELRHLEELRHVLGMLFVVELGSGPVICGQMVVSGHELAIKTVVPIKLLSEQDELRRTMAEELLGEIAARETFILSSVKHNLASGTYLFYFLFFVLTIDAALHH